MKEYIDREAARDLMEQALVDEWEIQYADDRLDEIPAADVVEVRHGRWIKSESSGLYTCSKCGRYATNSDVLNWEYCNCGAKMDGGVDDGNS